MNLTRGTEVATYRIISPATNWGVEEAFLAEDMTSKAMAVLRFLPTRYSGNPVYSAQFKRSAQRLAKLRIPGLCDTRRTGEIDGEVFQVLAYVEGPTLRHFLDTAELSSQEAERHLTQIAASCEAILNDGFAGIELSPAKVVLEEIGSPVLVDIGLVSLLNDKSILFDVMADGSINYLSPEQVRGEHAGAQALVFSLGALFYEMLTGTAPFARADIESSKNAILYDTPSPVRDIRSEIPEDYQTVLDRCLAKEPSLRYQTLPGLLEDLARLRDNEKLSPTKPTVTTVPVSEAALRTVYVDYLANLGPQDEEYLGYCFTEDLIADLSCLEEVRTVPLREPSSDIRPVSGMTLKGSIEKKNDRVKLTALLFDIQEQKNIWEDVREAPLSELPGLRREFLASIRSALGIYSTADTAPESMAPTFDSNAYDHCLRGRYTFDHKQTEQHVETARRCFLKALEIQDDMTPALIGLARLLIYEGKYDEARTRLSEALEICKQSNLAAEQVEIHTLLGRSASAQSDHEPALHHLNEAVRLAQESGYLAGEAEAYTQLLLLHKIQDRFEGADELFKKTMKIIGRLGDETRAINALGYMGWIYMNKGMAAKARPLFERALPLTRQIKSLRMEAYILNSIAASYFGAMGVETSRTELDFYGRAKKIWIKLGDSRNLTGAANNIGLVLKKQGQYRRALEQFEDALAKVRQLGEKAYMAMILGNLAETQVRLGKYADAVERAGEGIEVARSIEHASTIVQNGIVQGEAFAMQGDWQKAQSLLRSALTIAREKRMVWELVAAQISYGELHFWSGDYETARPALEEAFDASVKGGYEEYEIKAACYLAAFTVLRGESDKGIRRLEQLRISTMEAPLEIVRLLLLGAARCSFNPTSTSPEIEELQTAAQLARESEYNQALHWIKSYKSLLNREV